jgi:WD40 repeat protein
LHICLSVRFAHAFHFDTGSSIGEIIGHTKTINSVSIRPCRPLRAVTASDDFTVNLFAGIPYKFVKSIKNHSRFVQCVQYSPDGSFFASAGADGKVFIYDGDSGETKFELVDGNDAHSSGVLALSWSPDSKKLLTSSMDQTSKIWDVKCAKLIRSLNIKLSSLPQDNQVVGNLWTKNGILVILLSGKYALVNAETGEIIKEFGGHQKGLSALGEANDGHVLSASYDGQIYKWDVDKECFQDLTSSVSIRPENQIQHISILPDGATLINSPFESKLFIADNADGKSSFEIISSSDAFNCITPFEENLIAGLASKTLKIINRNTKEISTQVELGSNLTCAASYKSFIAVGSEDKQVFIFQIENGGINRNAGITLTANLGSITTLAISPDGKYLAVGDDMRRIRLYSTDSWEPTKANWCHHSAKISCLKWTKDGKYLLSAALDNAIMVWSPEKLIRPVATASNAHAGPIVDLICQEDNRIISASQDGSIRVWRIKN